MMEEVGFVGALLMLQRGRLIVHCVGPIRLLRRPLFWSSLMLLLLMLRSMRSHYLWIQRYTRVLR